MFFVVARSLLFLSPLSFSVSGSAMVSLSFLREAEGTTTTKAKELQSRFFVQFVHPLSLWFIPLLSSLSYLSSLLSPLSSCLPKK